MDSKDFEKLGAFYLGAAYDAEREAVGEELLLYDSKDLTTHAVCVGMTGSGKTGLCLSLLEEAAIDGIPAIVIDPKGDMGNLALTFPELEADDFEPWVDPGTAARKGLEVSEYARETAQQWREGLVRWGQDGARIKRLRDACEVEIYTPGSDAGIPLTVLRSFDAPPQAIRDDMEAFAERIQASVSGLLTLLGVDADPVLSRESILLANILQEAWAKGRNLGLADLIRDIQDPPFERLGVLDLESFYPANDRFALAMALNGLLASPRFRQWLEGEPLDIQNLLWTASGKPRIAVLSIAHLSDSERMFFVTILLNEVVSWMRSQAGTGSLRALLYMDEIFGYFPPSAEPPSKRPMLTLLKQARAYGVGVVLATQNPVDLDYKGLANTGTWFLGRMQTERDKLRVLDGLEGAMAGTGRGGFDRAQMDRLLSGLGERVFLMNNVHEDQPLLFHTRWALSYLRGPMTRAEIKALRAERSTGTGLGPGLVSGLDPLTAASQRGAHRVEAAPLRVDPRTGVAVEPELEPPPPQRPVVPAAVGERFLPLDRALAPGQRVVYRPALIAGIKLHHVSTRVKVDDWSREYVLAPFADEEPFLEWSEAEYREGKVPKGLGRRPEVEGAQFGDLPGKALDPKAYKAWAKRLARHLYEDRERVFWKHRKFRLISERGESEREFRARVRQSFHEKRDMDLEKLRKRYGPKLARIQERIRKAEQKIDREEEQFRGSRRDSVINVGTTMLGSLFGRKLASYANARRAGSAAKSIGRASKEKRDIERAKADLEVQEEKLEVLELGFEDDVGALRERYANVEIEVDEVVVRPRKADIDVSRAGLVWVPWRVGGDGIAERGD